MHKPLRVPFFSSVLLFCAFIGSLAYLDTIEVSEDIVKFVWLPFFTVVMVVNYYMELEVKVKLVKWGIIYILILVLGVVLGMWFDKQTIYSALMLGYNDYQIPLFPLVIGVFALYLPVTWIFWRRVCLLGCWKLLFCLTIYPIFIVLMVIKFLVDELVCTMGIQTPGCNRKVCRCPHCFLYLYLGIRRPQLRLVQTHELVQHRPSRRHWSASCLPHPSRFPKARERLAGPSSARGRRLAQP